MIADQPFVSFNKKGKKATKKNMDDLADRWLKSKGDKKGTGNPLEDFKGGQKTSMSDFFKKTDKQ